MNLPILSYKFIKEKPFNTFLNVLVLSLGIAIIIFMMLINKQIEDKLARNTQGIDLVVGAKGSPLQVILCSIFHLDFPTGNIPLEEANLLAKNPMIAYAIQMALGDSHRGFRLVGTSHAYPNLYKAELKEGKMWAKTLEVTAGATVAKNLNLRVGDKFFGAHGLSDNDQKHDEHAYVICGILKENNTVLDNLLLTNVESVWQVHEEHEEGEEVEEKPKEITAMLLKFRSPVAALMLPRQINSKTNMQAASPAFEIARLMSMLGVGIDILNGFAYLIIFIALLNLFIALYNALKERSYDLAVMRALGASPFSLFLIVVMESLLITGFSALLGVGIGHLVAQMLAFWLPDAAQAQISGAVWLVDELYVVAAALLIGFFTALIPAMAAYKTNISEVLAKE